MASGTYIGQAQIEVQVTDEAYSVGDIVVWKIDKDRPDAARYLVEGFDGDRVILRLLDRTTWTPQMGWFVRRDNERCPQCGRWSPCDRHGKDEG